MKRTVTKDILLVLLGTASILMVPLLAMQFIPGISWDLFDVAVVGVLLGGAGLLYVLLSRMVSNTRQRALIGAALALAFLVVYVDLAVGIFGTPISGS